MLNVLRRRNFALLWFGQLISMAGDWLLIIALPFYIYELTGSTLATGAMFVAQILPSLLLGSLAGVFVDRWDRRRVMLVSDLLRGLVLLLLLVVRSTDLLWLIYLVAFVQSAVGQFFMPAKNALIPRLVEGEDLPRANSLTAISESLTRLVGPSLGGVLFAAFGLPSVVALDALTFFVSAVMLALMVVPPLLGTPADTPDAHPRPSAASRSVARHWTVIWSDWLAGMRFVRADQMLAPLFFIMAAFALADMAFSTLMVAFAKTMLHVGTPELGVLLAAQGLGGLLGGLLLARLGDRMSPQRWIALTCVCDGVLLFLIFNLPVFEFALAMIFIAGILMVGLNVGITTLLQRAAADSYRGRVFGAWQATSGLMRLLGTLLAGSLAEVLGILPVLDAGAFLWVISGVLAIAFLPGVIGHAAVFRRPPSPTRPAL